MDVILLVCRSGQQRRPVSQSLTQNTAVKLLKLNQKRYVWSLTHNPVQPVCLLPSHALYIDGWSALKSHSSVNNTLWHGIPHSCFFSSFVSQTWGWGRWTGGTSLDPAVICATALLHFRIIAAVHISRSGCARVVLRWRLSHVQGRSKTNSSLEQNEIKKALVCQ